MNTIRMLIIFAAFCWVVPSQSGEQRLSLDQFASQLDALKTELHELRLEVQMAKVAQLEKQLAAVRVARKKLEEAERFAGEEMAALDRRLAAPELSAEERAETQTERREVFENSIRRIRPQRAEAERNELECARELHAATGKLNALNNATKRRE